MGVVRLQVLSDGRVATFTTRGPVLEQRADGEAPSFPWTCSQGYGDMGQVFIPQLATDDEGTLLAATLAGIYRRQGAGCAWERTNDAALRFVTVGDVYASTADLGQNDGRFYAVTAEPIPNNSVARSDDRGATWTVTDVGDARMQSVRDAPSNEDVVVAAGFRGSGESLTGVVVRSVDRGASFSDLEIPFIDGELTLVVDAIALDDPDAAYLRTVTDRRGDATEERLLLLRGGETTELLRAPRVRGVAAGAGGRTWVITEDALLRVNSEGELPALTTIANAAFTAVAYRDGVLFAAPEPAQDEVAMVQRVDPETGSVSATLSAYTDVVSSDRCDDGATNSVCRRDLDDLIRDAAALAPPEPVRGGCAVQSGPEQGGASGLALLALFVFWHQRDRRRGQRRPR